MFLNYLCAAIFLMGSVCGADDLSLPHSEPAVLTNAPLKEITTSYLNQYLAQQYRDSILRKSISFSVRNHSVRAVVTRLAAHCGLSVVMQGAGAQRVAQMKVENKAVGTVLHALLAGHTKKWGIVLVESVLHVAPHAVLLRRARLLLEGGCLPRQQSCIVITHMPWHESTKMRLEAIWHHCTREHVGSRRSQYFFLDDASKQVLVQGSPEQVAQFKQMVAAFDTAQPQVQLSARIILVRTQALAGLGFGITGPKKAQVNALPDLLTPSVTLPFVFGGSELSMQRLNAVLYFAERRQKVRTLLAPHLLSGSGQAAQLLEGQSVPIETATQQGEEGQVRTVRSAQYKEVGVQLKVTPHVLAGSSLIRLNVLVENSQVATTSTSKHYPTIATSRIKNVVTVRSGQVVMLGGLVRRRAEDEQQGIPWLARLPLIGWLFRGRAQHNDEQRLYVLLRAVVV